MKRLVLVTALFLSAGFFSYLSLWLQTPPPTTQFGITFSTLYTRELGLNPREVYLALLDQLRVRLVRLPIYWPEVAPASEQFDWQEVDWLVREAEKRGVSLTLALGVKVPRWPECHEPNWLQGWDAAEKEKALLAFVETAVRRYQGSSALVRWQVENEPLLSFGLCPLPNPGQIRREVALVRSLDERPIQITASGELETWHVPAVLADVLGVSVYRSVWSDWFGYIIYPLPPAYYRLRAFFARPLVDKVVVAELQAEAWLYGPRAQRSRSEWARLFTAPDLMRSAAFASQIGVPEVYLWGAEWWYYMLLNGEPELWQAAQGLFN